MRGLAPCVQPSLRSVAFPQAQGRAALAPWSAGLAEDPNESGYSNRASHKWGSLEANQRHAIIAPLLIYTAWPRAEPRHSSFALLRL
jgi:hypothetical protein